MKTVKGWPLLRADEWAGLGAVKRIRKEPMGGNIPFGVLTAFVAFFGSTAQAQIVITSSGLQCGGIAVPYDMSHGATLGANESRRQVLDDLYTFGRDALEKCAANGSLPGCVAMTSWEQQLRVLYTDKDDVDHEPVGVPALLPRATETEALAESVRVLAHQFCSTSLQPSNPSFDPSCTALIRAEEALAPQANAPKDLKDFYPQLPQFNPSPRTTPAINLRADAVAFARPATRSLRHETFCKSKADCSGSACTAGGVCAQPPPAPTPQMILFDYFKAIDANTKRQEMPCERAEFYVSPSGALVHHSLVIPNSPNKTEDAKYKNTLCVDTALYSIDRPFAVEITEYRFGAPDKSLPVAIQTLTAWPGEPSTLTEPLLGSSMVRVTVLGYPSGVSLRALALQGPTPVLTTTGASDLIVSQRSAADQQDIYQAKAATVSALNRLALAIGADKTFSDVKKTMNAAIAAAVKPAAVAADLESARQMTLAASEAFSAALSKFATDSAPNDAVAASQAVNIAQALVVSVPGSISGTDGIATLQGLANKITGLAGAISDQAADNQTQVMTLGQNISGQSQTLERLCRLSTELIPVVDEDVLLDEQSQDVYVLDYDFDAGFQHATEHKLMHSDRIFIRVRHVLPGGAIALVLGDSGIVQHSVSLVGLPASTSPTTTPAAAASTTSSHPITGYDDPDKPLVEARSTQILPIARLDGARRYDLTVCAQTGPSPPPCSDDVTPAVTSKPTSSPAPATTSDLAAAPSGIANQATATLKTAQGGGASPATTIAPIDPSKTTTTQLLGTSRILARNTIVVHEERYLGVRAGFGGTVVDGAVRTVATTAGTPQYYVRERKWNSDFALPLLLTLYPSGRDAVEGPQRVSYGLVAGLDLLKIGANPGLYLGVTLDFSGFGLTVGGVAQRIESVNAPAGTYLSSSNAGTTQNEWHPGVFFAMTTDLDIFEAVFKDYFASAKWPTVGTQ